MNRRVGCDTNILLRFTNRNDSLHDAVRSVIKALIGTGYALAYTPQNLREFWNVATRPADRNGYGWTTAQADENAARIESFFELLPDSDAMHMTWRRLVVEHEVKGVQVHDARLAAALVSGCQAILTLNMPTSGGMGF